MKILLLYVKLGRPAYEALLNISKTILVTY